MAEALAAVKGGGGSPRERALAGWNRYLVEGNPKDAKLLFASADDDLYGLAGQLDLAQRDLDLESQARLAIRLAALGANHPLGRVAAHAMLELTGESPHLDAELADGARAILKGAVSPGVGFVCRMVIARIDEIHLRQGWPQRFAEAGAVTSYALSGPFAPLHELSFPQSFSPEAADQLEPSYLTPVGKVVTRAVPFPTGDVRLYGEPERGDIYYLASDLTVRGGAYLLHTLGGSPHQVWVDGKSVLVRPPASLESGQQAAALSLAPGVHRLLLKMSRAEGGQVSVFLLRGDGAAEDLHARAATGAAPQAAPPPAMLKPPEISVQARQLEAELAPEAGEALARYLAAHDALGRDLEGAKVLLAGLDPFPETAPLLTLRAQLTLSDHSLPDRTAKGRASRDLEAATTHDAGDAAAWLLRATESRAADQLDDAKGFLEKASAVAHSPALDLARAQLELAQNLEALADADARRAVELLPGYCDAVALRYDLARRREDVATADGLAKELAGCPEGLERRSDLAKARADLALAEKLGAERLARLPASWRVAADLAELYVAAKRYKDAAALLQAQAALWPRNADVHKRLAQVLTLAGDAAGALAEKQAALALDGDDLQLRRQLSLAQGHELLDEFAVDDAQVIADFEKAPKPAGISSAASAYVLDLGGVRVLPDGTQLERIHTIAKVLDQRGIPQLAEQHLPSGAVPLKLQTRKKDGRVLEPEALGDKEGVSLPDVQVGDYVDVEYLAATSARSPAEPGWSSVPFFFRIANAPLFRSTYTVEAPADSKLQVDAHNMKAPEPKREGEYLVAHYEAHQVPLFIPEPGAPRGNEYLPFMQVGTGAGVEEGLLPFADSIVGRATPTLEVRQFAQAAVGQKQGIEAIRALFQAVSEKVKGEANDIGDRASLTLARERGSRLWLLQGALEALGIPSHVALIRPFTADPAPYRFPNTDLFTYPVLYVEPPGSKPLWLDPSVRFGPFDAVPEQAAGGHDALVLPAPGEAMRTVKTPAAAPDVPKKVKLHLELDAQGNVVAQGQEIYEGFDAAYLRQALQRYDELQQRQAVEVALSRSFHGAALESLDLQTTNECGAPLALTYKFTSREFARPEPGKLVLATPIFPLSLGQRFVALAQRTTPLLIAGAESTASEIRIELPPGFKPLDLGEPANIQTPFGGYKRVARLEGGTLVLDELAQLNQGRIMPVSYPDFVKFTASVDQAQQQQMVLGEQHAAMR